MKYNYLKIHLHHPDAGCGVPTTVDLRPGMHGPRMLALVLATQAVFTSGAWAQIAPSLRAVHGSGPLIETARQGADVVHIAAPSAAGVSHNQYQHFNVAPGGLILNNSADVTDTMLAGRVAPNPHLGDQPARVILNEVTSASQSTLRGAIEVAGHRADVIVANPNGIQCDGCGFLNVGRATLTTGLPSLGRDGSVQSFGIQGGHLTIGAGGLDARGLQQLDLLARGIVIDGPVQAERIHAIAGANRVNYGKTPEVASEAHGRGAAPKFAIDIGELGGMHARQIYLLSTERGLGVNSLGRLTANEGDLRLNAEGELRVHDVYGEQGVSLASVRGELTVTGVVASPGRVVVSAGQSIHNHGSLSAGESLLGSAPEIRNSGAFLGGPPQAFGAGGVELKGRVSNTVDARIFSSGDLTIDGPLRNFGGEVRALGDMAIAGEVTNENADLRVERKSFTKPVSEVLYTDERALENEFNAAEVRIDGRKNLIVPSTIYPFDHFGHESYDFEKLASGCANGDLAGQFCAPRLAGVLEVFGLSAKEVADPATLPERRTALMEELKQKLEAFNSDLAMRRSERYFVRKMYKHEITEDKVVSSRPGKILAGGSLRVAGGANLDSLIAAGGAFTSSAGFENHATVGERTVTALGHVQLMLGEGAEASNERGAPTQPQSVASVVSSELFALDALTRRGKLGKQGVSSSSGSTLSASSVQVHASDQAFVNSGLMLAHGGAGPRGEPQSSDGVIQINAGRIAQRGEMVARAIDLRAEKDIVVSGGQLRGMRGPLTTESGVTLHAEGSIELRPAMHSSMRSEGHSHASASLAGRQSLIAAQTVRLQGGQDIVSEGALVMAEGDLSIKAGRHIDVEPAFEERNTEVVADTATARSPSHWREGRVTARASRFEAGGVANITAGQQLGIVGSHAGAERLELRGQGVVIDAALTEQRIDVQTANGQKVQHIELQRQSAGPTTLAAGSEAVVRADTDLQITGSEIKVMSGRAHLSAGADLRVRGAVTGRKEVANSKSGEWSWLSHSETALSTTRPDTGLLPASLEGQSLILNAGRDLNISASSVAGHQALNLQAGKDVALGGEQYTHEERSSRQGRRRIGLTRSVGVNGLLGRVDTEDKVESSARVVAPTTVSSRDGDVTIRAEGSYRQAGSDLLTNHDVTIFANDIELLAAEGRQRKFNSSDFRQYGLTVGPSQKGALGAFLGAYSQGVFATMTQSRHAQILNSIAGLRQAYRGYSQLPAARDHAYEVASQVPSLLAGEVGAFLRTLSPSIGLGWNDSRENPMNETGTSIRESTISAGGNIRLHANSENGSLRTAGAQLIGERVELGASKIELGAASSRRTHAGESYMAGMGLAVAYETGGNAGASAYANYASGVTQGSAGQYTTTHVTAKAEAVVAAKADISLRGASLNANSVNLKAGGSLAVETLQDLDEAQSYRMGVDTNAGVKEHYSAGIAGAGGRGALRYAMATSPSGVLAGAGGFNIDVKEKVSLMGGVIDSLAPADKNRIVTGALQSQDISNVSGHDSFFLGGSVGYDQSQVRSVSETPGVPGFTADAARSVTRSFIAPSSMTLTQNGSGPGGAKAVDVGARAEPGESKNLDRQPDIGHVLLRQHQVSMAIGALGPDGLAAEWDTYANAQQGATSENGNLAPGWARDGWWRQAGHAVIDLMTGRWWMR